MTTPWSYAGLIESLQKLAFFERASAHVLAGWMPKIPDLHIKLGMARHLYESMNQAYQLRQALLALGRKAPHFLVVPRDWVRLMTGIDALPTTDQLLAALYFVVKARVLDEYRSVLANADPLFDAQLLHLIRCYLPLVEAQQQWAAEVVKYQQRSSPGVEVVASLRDQWNSAAYEDFLPLDQSLWAPLDRAPHAVRPESFESADTGALRVFPLDAFRDREGIGIFLHNSIGEEYTTLELMSRNSYEHPELPWAFHLAMARQAADEARHAQILQRLAAGYGVTFGDYPVYVTTYDLLYQFEPCEPASVRELIWRLLLRCTYQEGLALDDLAFQIRARRFLNQPDLLQAWTYILVDEVFHVENGLKWSRTLCEQCGLDVMAERQMAYDYFISMENHARLQFIVSNPERAIAEAHQLQKAQERYALPFQRELAIGLRKQAGFSDAEIQQVIDWGIY